MQAIQLTNTDKSQFPNESKANNGASNEGGNTLDDPTHEVSNDIIANWYNCSRSEGNTSQAIHFLWVVAEVSCQTTSLGKVGSVDGFFR